MSALIKEADILASILDYLAAKRILAFRQQTGALRVGNRMVRFGTLGMADILALPQMLIETGDWIPAVLWIEVKSPDGRGQSALQRSFMNQVREQGHFYAVCKSIEDVDAALAEIARAR